MSAHPTAYYAYGLKWGPDFYHFHNMRGHTISHAGETVIVPWSLIWTLANQYPLEPLDKGVFTLDYLLLRVVIHHHLNTLGGITVSLAYGHGLQLLRRI